MLVAGAAAVVAVVAVLLVVMVVLIIIVPVQLFSVLFYFGLLKATRQI